MHRSIKILPVITLIAALTGLYWHGAVQQLTLVNTKPGNHDQSSYMSYARTLYESNYNYVGDGNRMPIYPFLQSLFYRPGLSDQAFFQQGKVINLILSIFLLSGIGLIFYRSFHWLHALNLILITAFTVFIFKAGWFQAELLFYFINFCLFLMMWRLMKQPSWPLAVLTGLVAALAHLTKASILPGLLIFITLTLLKGFWLLYHQRSSDNATATPCARSHLFAVFLVALFFIGTLLPYIRTNKRVFGQYFYNVNSTFYIWYDSWEEVRTGTRAHGDRDGWPDMPEEQIPSMSKYLKEHTRQQILERFQSGSLHVLASMIRSYGYLKYALIYTLWLLGTALLHFKQTGRLIIQNSFLVFFLATYFIAYFLLYAWYTPIDGGNRLVLAQFLPFMFTLSCGLDSLLRTNHFQIKSHNLSAVAMTNLFITVLLIMDIYSVLTIRVSTVYGGS